MGAPAPPATLPSHLSDQDGLTRHTDYADLMRRVKRAGLLERRPAYYLPKIAVTVGAMLAGWTAFVLLGNSWWQLATAVFLAVVSTQFGFIGHDAGHHQIFRSRRGNYAVGILIGNLGIGLSYGWWVNGHNRHHAHPNQRNKDPDIELEALSFTADQAGAKRGVTRFIARYQAYLFFPLLFLEALQLHIESVSAVVRPGLRNRALEALMLGLHLAGYLGTVFLVLSPVKAIVFVLVHQALFGLYLGCSFAPNHKGMPILEADDQTDFLRRQVLTARNVRGGWLTDFALGGLNYQIEHHLFPSMPRPNLRRSQAMIQDFCRQRDVPYCETSLVRSYVQALTHLHAAGRALRH
jgi:fatty acid desaturase